MSDFSTQPPFDIGRRIEIRGSDAYSWLVVLRSQAPESAGPEDFAHELEAILFKPVRVASAQGLPLGEIRRRLEFPPDDVLILWGFESYTAHDWEALDIHRAALIRPGTVVLWLSPVALRDLCANAPNLRSFIGGSIFALSPTGDVMSGEERSERIRELEAHYDLKTAEVVELATARKLPPEPEFVEWLVLIGRGDLV
jgi:hypothetical protein